MRQGLQWRTGGGAVGKAVVTSRVLGQAYSDGSGDGKKGMMEKGGSRDLLF